MSHNDGEWDLPRWVRNENGTSNDEQYAQMLFDYIKFMHDKGFKIDMLGITNENRSTLGISASKYRYTVEKIKDNSTMRVLSDL